MKDTFAVDDGCRGLLSDKLLHAQSPSVNNIHSSIMSNRDVVSQHELTVIVAVTSERGFHGPF
jgi:hypothetical protein